MGRVPLLFLVFACTALSACTPEADSPDTQEQRETNEAVRDAGQAARDAMKKAGNALRRLSGANPDAPVSESDMPVPPTPEPDVAAPATDLPQPVPAPVTPVELPISTIAPIPDETEQLEQEQHIQVERDASVATQEAKEKILEATRRAAARFREAGAGMVDAFRHDDLEAEAPGDTMSDTPAGASPPVKAPAPKTPVEAPRPE